MLTIPPLESMGRRIVIMGPTNSGKSTLAQALARRLELPAIHLDQLHHLPGTDWVKRDEAEFQTLHDEAILEAEWVMDGNYSRLMPQRFARATGAIVLDDHYLRRLARYFRRTLFERNRAGNLEGNQDSLKWVMIQWVWTTRNNTGKYRRMTEETGLPYVFCDSMDEVKRLYGAWGLDRR